MTHQSAAGSSFPQEWWRVTLASIGDGVIATDAQGRVAFLNPVAQSLTGWTEAEAEGHPLEEVFVIINETTRSKVENPVAKVFQIGQIIGLGNHTVLISRDGREIPIDDSAAPIRDESDQLVGVVLIFRDITERRRTELAQSYLAAIVESSDDAIIGKTLESVITSWNRGAERMFGYMTAEAIGQQIYLIIPPERHEEEAQILEKLKRGERIDHYQTVRRRKDGTLLDVSLTISPIKDRDGHIIGASKIARDITAQKKTEEEIERRYRDGMKLTKTSRALVGIHDFDEVTEVVCRTARELTGADGATFVLRESKRVRYAAENTVAPLWKGQDFPIEQCLSGWTMLHGEAAVIEDIYADQRIPHDAYRQTFVQSLVMMPVGPGTPVAAIGVYWAYKHKASAYEVELLQSLASVADLALVGVRAYDETRRARIRAEQASRLKDEFLATVSHELRNPLNTMLGWVRLLQAGSLGEKQAQQAIETIERSVQVQTLLIDDLLDVSRIITGKLRLDVRPVMVASVVESAITSVTSMAEAKGVRLQSVLDPQAGPVSGDPGRLQQIVWNLLSNAIKFTPRSGRVQIRVERINSHIEIIVSDTGQGISPEFMPHVFDRFRQAEGGTTRQYGGLGLGLAIVRHLVELHGGQVTADSPGEGQGATFTVQLPLMVIHPRQDKEERVHPRAETKGALALDYLPNLEGVKVLVIDDELDTRNLLRTVLEQCGAEVREAGSAEQGLREAKEWRPSIVVSDIGMPDEDGYQFMEKFREWERDRGGWTPAVALTAYARAGDRLRALATGYQVHVAKPIEPVELALVVASQLGRGS
jgi:PAS domain S-box-containing protein